MTLPSILTPYTFWIKVVFATVVVAAIGYSYLWTYHQGQLTGQAKQVTIDSAAQDAITKRFNNQRVQDLQEERKMYDQQLANEQKKVKDLNNANRILKEQSKDLQAALSTPIPDEYTSVLNRTRGSEFGNADQPSGDKPTVGTDSKVSSTPSSPYWEDVGGLG